MVTAIDGCSTVSVCMSPCHTLSNHYKMVWNVLFLNLKRAGGGGRIAFPLPTFHVIILWTFLFHAASFGDLFSFKSCTTCHAIFIQIRLVNDKMITLTNKHLSCLIFLFQWLCLPTFNAHPCNVWCHTVNGGLMVKVKGHEQVKGHDGFLVQMPDDFYEEIFCDARGSRNKYGYIPTKQE